MGNILAFTASSRPNSISRKLVTLAAETARQQGHQVQLIDLSAAGLQCCSGCGYCRTHDGCTIDDALLQALWDCTGIIIGFPIYFSGIAGQTKVWLDRLYPMISANFTPRYPGKNVLAIYTQGDGNENAFRPAIQSTNYVFRMCGWPLIDSILCAGTSAPGFEIPDSILARVKTAAEKL